MTDKLKNIDFYPGLDSRALIVGQSGSGKTFFAKWLLIKLARPTIIYDTKYEKHFDDFGKIYDNIKSAFIHARKGNIAIFRPKHELALNRDYLNEILKYHFNNGEGITAYIDEIYTFHAHTTPVPSLSLLLTQGRSKDISTIMSTQRPALISTFALSESDYFYIFTLTNEKDRLKLDGYIPGYDDLEMIRKGSYQFYFYNVAKSLELNLFNPVKIIEKKSKKTVWI